MQDVTENQISLVAYKQRRAAQNYGQICHAVHKADENSKTIFVKATKRKRRIANQNWIPMKKRYGLKKTLQTHTVGATQKEHASAKQTHKLDKRGNTVQADEKHTCVVTHKQLR